MKRFLLAAFALSATMAVGPAAISATGSDPKSATGSDPKSATGSVPKSVPDSDPVVVHVLNRIAFGARPGDVERVQKLGLERYIDEQLHPERIADADMAGRLKDLTTVGLRSREIQEMYERPAMQARRERKQNDGDPTPEMRELQRKARSVIDELGEQKILRAVYSGRQLEEVLTDFWFNHFNVDARKGRTRTFITEYERDAIRPHVLGRFRDLLGATAKSPAMLFYLDNWMSADPNGPHPPSGWGLTPRGRNSAILGGGGVRPQGARPGGPGQKARKGLNENYGRELMELHTLGVDGGYTQKDVTEVARAFTGWTIANPRQGDGFVFEPRIHDPEQKIVLGHVIKAGGGQSDGEQVLDILAKHPSTAHFIATRLVRRFVSDTPPAGLIDRAAARFRQTDGDLRDVMRTILTSPEFLAPDARGAKVKTPFDFVVSALRSTATDVADAAQYVRALQQLGMPLYLCQPPTGYGDTAEAWVNTGALVNRMNFALRLARNDKDTALAIGGPEFQRK
jgi:uncharacterized protein (DUF1800 family)